MGKFTKEKINELSEKLLIELTDEENEMILKEFNETIDEDINTICQIQNINEVEPMTHCLDDFTYELREDVYEGANEDIDDLLANCDDYIDTEVKVPKVVDD